MKNNKGKPDILRTVTLITVALVLLIMGTMTALTMGKYMGNKYVYSGATAADFYFESDLLTDAVTAPEYTVHGTSCTFELRNYADTLNFSPTDIKYTLSATGGTIAETAATLTGGSTAYHTFTVTPSTGSTSVTVTATSTSPYAKELKAIFNFKSESQYSIAATVATDTITVISLTVGFIPEPITITWDTGSYSYDNNNSLMSAATQSGTTGTCVIPAASLTAGQTYEIVFFKTSAFATAAVSAMTYGSEITVPVS